MIQFPLLWNESVELSPFWLWNAKVSDSQVKCDLWFVCTFPSPCWVMPRYLKPLCWLGVPSPPCLVSLPLSHDLRDLNALITLQAVALKKFTSAVFVIFIFVIFLFVLCCLGFLFCYVKQNKTKWKHISKNSLLFLSKKFDIRQENDQ